MSEFGDIEPEDAYSVDALPDPDQVAYRLHEIRAYLDATVGTGQQLPDWEDLSPEEQRLGLEIGAVIVQFLIDVDPDEPEAVARNLHNVRRFWASSWLPPWEDLPPEDRQVGIDVMDAILRWLRREGTLPTRGNL